MWFKNIQILQCDEDFTLNEETFNDKLAAYAIKPCGKTQLLTQGWGNPFGRDEEYYTHACNGCYLLALVREERLLPASVVRDATLLKIKALQQEEDRVLSAREKSALRDDVTFELLPKAFTKKTITYGYLDTQQRWLIIDSANPTRAEEFYTLLRDTLGRLQAHLPQTTQKPGHLLTHWLLDHDAPGAFSIEDSCELLDMKSGIGSIKFQQQDLSRPEIAKHIRDGHSVSELALSWEEKLSFTIKQDLRIRKIKLLDILTNLRKEDQAEGADQQLDADFALMTQTFSKWLSALLEIFHINTSQPAITATADVS